MNTKNLVFLLMFVLSFSSAFSKVYYVATNGSDTNDGSISSPFATIQKAQTAVTAGDTVYVRGGTYMMTESQIAKISSPFAYVTYLDKSGTSGKRINYWAYPNEKPIFNFSNVKPSGLRVYAFEVKGSWIHIKGLEVVGVQVTITTHTQSECFDNYGDNNIYEQLSMHDGQAIGFYLVAGSNNLILNCDAYNNYDYTSETKNGGNTDGFGCHPYKKGYTNNVFRGCRAWFNSDDGYDCINAYESVVFENCWAFYNGYSGNFVSRGDGNGFKAGGYGQAPTVSELPNPIPSHTVRFCMAYRNKAHGIYANHHVQTGSTWYNNTAYRNTINYDMLSQVITKSAKTGADTTLDCAGFNHILHNNVSFKYSTLTETNNLGTCDIANNTFTPNTSLVVSTDDFVSIDESLLTAPRQADGSLPEIGFLHLKAGSDLIDSGIDLGFSYNGAAPDMGAFEFKNSQAITFDNISDKADNEGSFQPNAIASSGLTVTYTSSNLNVAKIVDNNVVILGIGTTNITASQFGDTNYYAAPEVTRTLTVKLAQTITFEPLVTRTYSNSTFALDATTSTGSAITYTSSNPSVATIEGNIVSIVGVGTTTITATQAGDEYYASISISQTLTVESKTTILETESKLINNITISPNPSQDLCKLNFDLNTSSPISISIFDNQGKQVYTIHRGILEKGQIYQTIDISSLKQGTYVVRLQTKDGFKTTKLIRQ